MRKSSKMLSLVIALIFLFSAVTPALALSADAPDAGARLKALGIIEGYPDGSLGLERNITRAEMTVVLAEMSAMGSAANVLKSVPSKFSDVATNVWYTGYVNLAANQGWVSGYPDGSFKPNANVTYAEAVTMMLNVLGYSKGELPGTWPLNYLVKAAELGITDDVTFATGSPALRGDVFVFANEALYKEPVKWVSDDSEFVAIKAGETLLDKLGFTPVENVIVDDAFVLVGTGGEDDRTVSSNVNTSILAAAAEGFDVRPYVGVKSDFYVNDDEEIVAVKKSASVMTGEIDSVSGMKIKFDGNSKEYDFTNAVVIVNEELAGTSYSGIKKDSIVRYSVDGNNVTLLDFVDYDLMATGANGTSGLVDEVDVDDELVTIEVKKGEAVDLNTDDDNITLIGVDSLEDIQEWDVVYSNRPASSDDIAVYVVRNKVSGSATAYTSSRIRIAGTNYDIGGTWFYSTTNGDSFENGPADALSTLEKFSGESVTALLDGYGDVYAIFADVDPVAGNVAIVDGAIVRTQTGVSSYKYTVDLFLPNGTLANYEFKDKDVEIKTGVTLATYGWTGGTFSDWTEFDKVLIEYNLNSSGKIDAFEVLSPKATSVVLKDSSLEDFSRIGSYYRTNSTVFFQITGSDSDDWKMITWDDVKAAGTESGATYTASLYSDDSTDIDYVVFYQEVSGADVDYAVFLDSWKVGEDWYIEVATASGVKEYKHDGVVSGVYENDIVSLSFSGGLASFSVVSDVATKEVTLFSSPWDSTRSRLNLSETSTADWYDVDSDTIVINNSGTSPVVISASGVRRGDDVNFYANGSGLLKVLVITDR